MRSISSLRLLCAGALALSLLTAASQAQRAQSQRPAPALKSLEGHYLAAAMAEAQHDYEAALEQVEGALRAAREDPETTMLAFRVRLLAGQIPAAAQLAPRVLAINPGDGFANLALATVAIKQGKFAEAQGYFGKLAEEAQGGLLRAYSEAWLKVALKDAPAARSLIGAAKPAQADDPLNVMHLLHSGLIEEALGEKDAAARLLKQAAAHAADRSLRATQAYVGFLRRTGKLEEAREVVRGYARETGDLLTLDLLTQGETPRVWTAADGIADVIATVGEYVIAASQQERRRRSAAPDDVGDSLAMRFFRLALELNPVHDSARLSTAQLMEKHEQWSKAIDAYNGFDKRSPLQWYGRLRAAALQSEQGRLDDAAKALKAMVAERPERIDAAGQLGELYRGKENWKESVAAFDVAIARIGAKPEKRHWFYFFQRATSYERLKEWPKAEADLKTALELQPEQPLVLNYLGYTWIDRGENLDEGLKMLLRAIQLRPDDGAIADSVGWAYYRLGDFAKATEWLEKAIELRADDATIVEHLGDAYWMVNRRREALFQWERALRQKPDADRIQPIKDKLEGRAEPEKPGVGKKP